MTGAAFSDCSRTVPWKWLANSHVGFWIFNDMAFDASVGFGNIN